MNIGYCRDTAPFTSGDELCEQGHKSNTNCSFCEMLHCTALHCNAALQHTFTKNIGRANYMLFGLISFAENENEIFPREQLCCCRSYPEMESHRLHTGSQAKSTTILWAGKRSAVLPITLYCCTVILAVLPYLYNND